MKILVINCGSSSLKYQLFNMDNKKALVKGVVERIGFNDSLLSQKNYKDINYEEKHSLKDHKEALKMILKSIIDKDVGVIASLDEIEAVGHRVVHGGEKYSEAVLITEQVKEYIKECYKLAPLHNPSNMIGIEICQELMPNTKMVAVFDTAFHQSIPESAFIYGIPYEFYKEDHIRKYGFHGTSHMYVSKIAALEMKRDIKELKIITCHLGNGSSMCAIKEGKSIDTTMGFTPLEGLIMGSRCGSIDPAIILYLIKEKGYSVDYVNEIINKKSGVLGISGISTDFRDIEKASSLGNKRASLALEIFSYKIKGTIGYYAAIMGGLDAIVFTAGVGENGPNTRAMSLSNLEFLGIELDNEKNKVRGKLQEISKESSKVKVFVIPTNEELVIAEETQKII
ncbi:MAG: acetate kinase [Clostridiales bacterium]|nr:acetate kinase [Clostridiales bacterium]